MLLGYLYMLEPFKHDFKKPFHALFATRSTVPFSALPSRLYRQRIRPSEELEHEEVGQEEERRASASGATGEESAGRHKMTVAACEGQQGESQ